MLTDNSGVLNSSIFDFFFFFSPQYSMRKYGMLVFLKLYNLFVV